MSISQKDEHHCGLRPHVVNSLFTNPLNEVAQQEVACEHAVDKDDEKDVEDTTNFPNEAGTLGNKMGQQSGRAMETRSSRDQELQLHTTPAMQKSIVIT